MIKYAVKYNKVKYSLKTVGLDIQTDKIFRRKKMIPNHKLEKAFE